MGESIQTDPFKQLHALVDVNKSAVYACIYLLEIDKNITKYNLHGDNINKS